MIMAHNKLSINQNISAKNQSANNAICQIDRASFWEESHHETEDNNNILDQDHFPLNINDPGRWKNIDTKLRDLLVEKGLVRESNINFPNDENSRHFSNIYYTRKLFNGSF